MLVGRCVVISVCAARVVEVVEAFAGSVSHGRRTSKSLDVSVQAQPTCWSAGRSGRAARAQRLDRKAMRATVAWVRSRGLVDGSRRSHHRVGIMFSLFLFEAGTA